MPDISSPPAKRQRTEDALITRSDTWHSDGSLVLQAENTQFRVHWGLLALHSSVFRDMQGLPQPPDQPSIDGCPIVELQDTAVDVEHLLRALYYPKFQFQPALPFAVVAALIRLGRKYNFHDILELAVERVTFENPKTLEEYQGLFSDRKYRSTRIVPYNGIFFDIITLARENNILSALPSAYYRAAKGGLVKLLNGIPRGDGTVASLAPVDLHRCIAGRESLINAQYKNDYTWGWLRQSDELMCNETPGKCTKARDVLLIKYMEIVELWTFPFNSGAPKELCSGCRQRADELSLAGRTKIWNELPSFFDLPPWDELKNDM